MDIKSLIEANRQLGQTTLMVNVLKENASAVLIVGNEYVRKIILEQHAVHARQVCSVQNLHSLRGKNVILLFDTTAVLALTQPSQEKTRQINVKVEEALYNKVQSLSDEENSISAIVRKMIKNATEGM